MTQSIEEAWEGLTQHQPCVDDECPLCKAEEDAARALALAVLDECFPDAITGGTDWQRQFHAITQSLRRRIEDVGR